MITVTLGNSEPLFRSLALIEEGLSDFSVPLIKSDALIADSILDNFVVGGRPDGWPDITAASRASRKFDKGTPPLWDSGSLAALASSVAPSETIGDRSAQTLITPYGLIKLLEGPDVRAHQLGNPRGAGGEPARPYFVLQAHDEADIVAIHAAYLGFLVDTAEK